MTGPLRIKMPARLDFLEAFEESISQFARNQKFDSKRISEIQLAVEEALVNVFSYAYDAQDGEVELVCRVGQDGQLTIEIIDTGIPFDPLIKEDPDIHADLTDRKVGGLGVFFIKKVMDEVHYKRQDDQNILTLVVYKKRNG